LHFYPAQGFDGNRPSVLQQNLSRHYTTKVKE
jgi:hypothetical protein